jgi:putative inorganic carbon (HCO3(-)) transporter
VIDRTTKLIAAGELILLLLTSPLFLFFKPWMAPLLLLLPLLWLIRFYTRHHFVPRTPVDWPVLGLLFMTLVSLLVTPELQASLDKVVGLAYGVALFYAFVDWGQRQRSELAPALAVVVLGSGIALLSLLGTAWQIKWMWFWQIIVHLPDAFNSLPGAEGGFNPNTVSGTLILFLPLQLCLLWGILTGTELSSAQRKWWTVGVGLSLIPITFVLLLAQSRAAWAALIVGIVALIGIATKKAYLAVVLGMILAAVALVVIGPILAGNDLGIESGMTRSPEISLHARAEIWSRGLWAIAEYPLTGNGMDVFRHAAWTMYPLYRLPYNQDLGHAHNILIQVALDLGIPGLVAYLAFLGTTLIVGWQSFHKSASQMSRMIALGGVVGLIAHGAWSLVDSLPLGARTSFLWWLMVALVLTIAMRETLSIRQVSKSQTLSGAHRGLLQVGKTNGQEPGMT